MRFLVALVLVGVAACETLPPPLTVDELRSTDLGSTLTVEGPAPGGPGYRAQLVAYSHSGLTLRALVAVPDKPRPAEGFPVVVANHGYVPDPRHFGIVSTGELWRPGDYYRAVPRLFTSRGFVVVMPDYRGHATSDGYEYIDPQGDDAMAYYAEDVTALLRALPQLADIDLTRVYLWAHSMGGPVSLRALLATDVVRAASFWSPMSLAGLAGELDRFDVPTQLHHATDDPATPSENSAWLEDALRSRAVDVRRFVYAADAHFLDVADRELAADRDAAFFDSYR